MKTPLLSDQEFRDFLLDWYARNHRPLPWKGNKDPYLIWLSEIILQQTRVDQGTPYFLQFKKHFPRVEDLAAASRDEVMKHWQGLGYYSRARNLHDTARFIADELNGQFPRTYTDILSLKGVGPYTAAAIASFAYDLPYAVVDGNVFRVLARIYGIELPIDTTSGKKRFNALANQLLDAKKPGTYNQAIMDFGATHCTPRNPHCDNCPVQSKCIAFQEKTITRLPRKEKKLKKKDRFFHYLVLQCKEETILQRRQGKDIWQELFEFPLIELSHLSPDLPELRNHPFWQQRIGSLNFEVERISKPFLQTLSHQKIHAKFWTIKLDALPEEQENQFIKAKWENLSKFAFPKIIDWYLRDKSLYLNLQ